jgi:hypothetical protein
VVAEHLHPTQAKYVAAPKTAELSKAPELTIAINRGQCYSAYFWVQPGSRLREDVHVATEVVTKKQQESSSLDRYRGNKELLTLDNYCPQDSGHIRIFFGTGKYDASGNHQLHVANAGTGTVRYAMWSVRTTEAELRSTKDSDDGDMCKQCMNGRLRCQEIGPHDEFKTCADQFDFCLRAAGIEKTRCVP